MLSSANGNTIFRGNTEFLLEGFYGSVFEGSGDWLAGGTLMLRYTLSSQMRSGFPTYRNWRRRTVGTICTKDQDQTLIGRSFEFNLQAGLGLRYQINNQWAVFHWKELPPYFQCKHGRSQHWPRLARLLQELLTHSESHQPHETNLERLHQLRIGQHPHHALPAPAKS